MRLTQMKHLSLSLLMCCSISNAGECLHNSQYLSKGDTAPCDGHLLSQSYARHALEQIQSVPLLEQQIKELEFQKLKYQENEKLRKSKGRKDMFTNILLGLAAGFLIKEVVD